MLRLAQEQYGPLFVGPACAVAPCGSLSVSPASLHHHEIPNPPPSYLDSICFGIQSLRTTYTSFLRIQECDLYSPCGQAAGSSLLVSSFCEPPYCPRQAATDAPLSTCRRSRLTLQMPASCEGFTPSPTTQISPSARSRRTPQNNL